MPPQGEEGGLDGVNGGSEEVMDAMELKATHDMVHYCFEMLIHYLKGGDPPHPPFNTSVECPLFVTWEKTSLSRHRGHTRQLRGCIGTLSPRSLATMKDYVYSSAFRDRRFTPITEAEVSLLKCSVSLLVKYEDGHDVYDWEVGVHGIIISFKDSSTGQAFSATYLPEVALEQRWSKMEALESLARKAGYKGKLTDRFWTTVSLTRYRSSKTSLTYEDFLVRRTSTVGSSSISSRSSSTSSSSSTWSS